MQGGSKNSGTPELGETAFGAAGIECRSMLGDAGGSCGEWLTATNRVDCAGCGAGVCSTSTSESGRLSASRVVIRVVIEDDWIRDRGPDRLEVQAEFPPVVSRNRDTVGPVWPMTRVPA